VGAPTDTSTTAGRPRSEEAHRAILDAALELLVEVGYSALTMEGIASRAGVGKATIYRRWSSKLPLVIEAFGALPAMEESDSGDLVTDLERMLKSYLSVFNSTPLGAVYPSLVGECAHDPELVTLLSPLLLERRKPLMRALERAAARGELRPDQDLELAADLIVGPIAVRIFFAGGKLNPKIVRPIVEMALEGLRAS
jgi:AcrR family transcriptional regulator